MRKLSILVVLVAATAVAGEVGPVPATPKRPAVTEYDGVKVSEDYRWLEDSKSPEVTAWSDAENKRARAFLSSLPFQQQIHARVATLMKSRSPMWQSLEMRGGQLFALKVQPPKQQPFLVVRAS